jgi:integrase
VRGTGRIFKRDGSPFWWVAYYHHGKEQREVAKHVRTGARLEATEPNRHEAERFLKRRLGEIAAEEHGGPAFPGAQAQRVTVDDLLDALKADYELRGKGGERVESAIKKVRGHFGPWRAVNVSTEAVVKWQLALRAEGYKDATINRFCQLLGQAFNVAIETKRLSSGPAIKHLSETGNARTGFFTEIEIRKVISNLPEYLRDFVLFAYITGMRKGEVGSLRWSDVHGDAITLRAENSKNGEGRTIPLEDELAEIIERRQKARHFRTKRNAPVIASEYIFHRKGTPIASFRKGWANACKFAGVPGRLFHDLRRCAARNLLAAGVPQAVAMKITGHKTDSMFRRYAIVTVEQQREALQRAAIYRQQQAEQAKKQAEKVVAIN